MAARPTNQFITENRTAIFDWTVVLSSILLGFIFPSLTDLLKYRGFSWLMLSALIVYTFGSWLKHKPLYWRLNKDGTVNRHLGLLLFLLIGHWVVIYSVIIVSGPALNSLFGGAKGVGSAVSDTVVFAGLFLSIIICWLVYRSGGYMKNKKNVDATAMYYRELIADIMLCLSISFFTFAFWEKGMMSIATNSELSSPSNIWYLFIFLAAAFVLCYLPLRYLFLVEDHSSNQTWKRMLMIFGLVLLRTLFAAL